MGSFAKRSSVPQAVCRYRLYNMRIFPARQAENLRLQALDAHTQSLDGQPKALYGHQKPANGDFSIALRRLSAFPLHFPRWLQESGQGVAPVCGILCIFAERLKTN